MGYNKRRREKDGFLDAVISIALTLFVLSYLIRFIWLAATTNLPLTLAAGAAVLLLVFTYAAKSYHWIRKGKERWRFTRFVPAHTIDKWIASEDYELAKAAAVNPRVTADQLHALALGLKWDSRSEWEAHQIARCIFDHSLTRNDTLFHFANQQDADSWLLQRVLGHSNASEETKSLCALRLATV